jgi:penicillin-insensitive murein endopeptidase
MNPQRRRAYGTPDMLNFMKYLSASNAKSGRILQGDAALANGGPLIGGHASHEVGLDVDIWYRFASKKLTPKEIQTLPDVIVGQHKMVGRPGKEKVQSGMRRGAWNDKLTHLLRTASEYPRTARIFVTPALKKHLCNSCMETGRCAEWLRKIRPWWGHDDHFHVRLVCPDGSPDCKNQEPVAGGSDAVGVGCSGPEFFWWFDPDRTKKKTVMTSPDGKTKTDDPSFLAHEKWERDHAEENRKKPPGWIQQVADLPPQCQELKTNIQMQLKQ